MNVKQSVELKRPIGAARPFPWRCRHCGKTTVRMATIQYQVDAPYDGRSYAITIPELNIPVGSECGQKVVTEKVDEQIKSALRAHLRLMTPEEIRAGLNRINMTQNEVAARLGIAEATMSRWLGSSQIQSRAMDNFLRVFFSFPQIQD